MQKFSFMMKILKNYNSIFLSISFIMKAFANEMSHNKFGKTYFSVHE